MIDKGPRKNRGPFVFILTARFAVPEVTFYSGAGDSG